MQTNSTTHPLLLLNELDKIFLHKLEKQKTHSIDNNKWCGIGFRIGKCQFVVNNQYLLEILSANIKSSISNVPGAKEWLLGLVSLRGNPLPIIDLKQYLLGDQTEITSSNRLLVIQYNSLVSALLVDEVFGLRQFSKEDILDASLTSDLFPEQVQTYIPQSFKDNSIVRAEFSVSQLFKNNDFSNAARN